MSDDELVEAACVAYEERLEQGESPRLEELLPPSRHDLLERLARTVEVLARFREGPGGSARSTAGVSVRDGGRAVGDELLGGRYRPSVEVFAQGGLGRLHLAQDQELRRTVVVKRIRPDRVVGDASRARFFHEAEITGCLEHPGVVPVYGLGSDAQGKPFYAMRLVQGLSLQDATRRMREAENASSGAGLRELLRRFVAICETIAYAHSRGVIHRDIKPANLMLGEFGETFVVDWGLAKSLAGDPVAEQAMGAAEQGRSAGAADLATWDGVAKGTFAYMSPEQARGDWGEVGPATDIFALGATLYYLLTGKPPYAASATIEDVRLGRRARGLEAAPPTPRVLAAICEKALSRSPDDRYASASELGKEVERYLDDEPTTAYRESWLKRGARWARRRPGLVSGVGAALLALAVLGPLLFVTFRAKSSVESSLAQEQRARQEAERLRRNLEYTATIQQAVDAWDAGDGVALQKLLAQHELPDLDEADLRGFEWRYLSSRRRGALVTSQQASELCELSFSPDDRRLVTASLGGRAEIWELPTGRLMATCGGAEATTATSTLPTWARLFDASRLFVVHGTRLELFDATTGERRGGWELPLRSLEACVFDPAHDQLALASLAERKILVWRPGDGPIAAWPWPGILSHVAEDYDRTSQASVHLQFTNEGGSLAIETMWPTLPILDLATGAITNLSGFGTDGQTLSPGGRWVASRHPDGIQIEELRSRTKRRIDVPSLKPDVLCWAPDGRTVATGGQGTTVRLWDTVEGRSTRAFVGHENDVKIVAFSHSGRWLASASRDRWVLWSTKDRPFHVSSHGNSPPALAWSSQGSLWIAGGDRSTGDGELANWPQENEASPSFVQRPRAPLRHLSWLRDGAAVLASYGQSEEPGETWEIDVQTGARRRFAAPQPAVGEWNWLAMAGGQWRFGFDSEMFVGDRAGVVTVWSEAERRIVRELTGIRGGGYAMASSSGRHLLVLAPEDSRVWVYALPDLSLEFDVRTTLPEVVCGDVAADGALLVVGGGDLREPSSEPTELWLFRRGDEPPQRVVAPVGFAAQLCLLPGGERWVCADREGALHFGDGASLTREKLDLGAFPMHSQVMADGERLACVTNSPRPDERLRVIDLLSGEERRRYPDTIEYPKAVLWTPEGRELVVGNDSQLAVYDVESGARVREFDHPRVATGFVGLVGAQQEFAEEKKVSASARLDSPATAVAIRGARIALADELGALQVIDTTTGSALWRLAQQQTSASSAEDAAFSPGPIRHLEFLAGGAVLLTGAGGTYGNRQSGDLRTWDAETGTPLATWARNPQGVTALAVSHRGDLVASGSDWNNQPRAPRRPAVSVHSAKTGEIAWTWSDPSLFRVNSLAFAPDGGLSVAAQTLWRGDEDSHVESEWIQFDRQGAVVRRQRLGTQMVQSIAHARDGRTLAVAAQNLPVRLLHVGTGDELLQLPGPRGASQLAFSQAGDALAAAIEDTPTSQVVVWSFGALDGAADGARQAGD